MTKKEMYNAILAIDAVAANEEMVTFLNHQIDLLDSRKGSKTPTKTQKENEVIKEQILKTLEAIREPATVTDILTFGVEGYELSNQKTSALLRQLIEAQKVVKTIESKKAYFALA